MPNTPYTLHDTLLSLQHVSKRYGNKQVLKDVTYDVKDVQRAGVTQGQVVGVLGPSGIGKSTLLRILAGLEEPDEGGRVLIGPKQVPTSTGFVGAVFQNYPLFEDRSVMANLIYGGRRGGLSAKDAKKKAAEMLDRFGLSDFGDALPAKLSGGQRQRVAIAQQLLCSNHLLILDEPFSGLDPMMKDAACDVIIKTALEAEDMTIVVITHDIRECLKVCDEIWMIGRDRGPDGKPIPGAYIKKVYDMKAMGLAWDSDLTHRPEFAQFEREVRDYFKEL